MELTLFARETAERLLSGPLPRRWQHVQAVAAKAGRAAVLLPGAERDLLVASAWLHDVGYSPDLAVTGFHPLDGARWLREAGVDEQLSSLVAFHSCAEFEAAERGLSGVLIGEFVREESLTADILWWADMTTGPDGQDFELAERLEEIRSRYGPDHLVTRFWAHAEPTITATVQRVDVRLASVPPYVAS